MSDPLPVTRTEKPSAALWSGARPSDPRYSFMEDRTVRLMLANPGRYDRALIDTSRLYVGNYQFSWLGMISNYTRRSLVEAVYSLLLQNKLVGLYAGGIHFDSAADWRTRFSEKRAVAEIRRIVGFLSIYLDHPRVTLYHDGAASTPEGEVLSHCETAMGWNVGVEAYTPPGRLTSGFPSLSTGAVMAGPNPIPALYAPSMHGILISNSVGLDKVPSWRDKGYPIYVTGGDWLNTGKPPVYWDPAPAASRE